MTPKGDPPELFLSLTLGDHAAQVIVSMPCQEDKGMRGVSEFHGFPNHRPQFCANIDRLGGRGEVRFDQFAKTLACVIEQLGSIELNMARPSATRQSSQP